MPQSFIYKKLWKKGEKIIPFKKFKKEEKILMSWGFVVVRGGVSKNKKFVKTDMIFIYFEEGKSSSN